MTCIVGLRHEGQVYIGGDSAATSPVASGAHQTIIADEKVFTNGPFLVGISGQPRLAQLIRYAFDPPPQDPGIDVREFMATQFVDALRHTLKTGGLAGYRVTNRNDDAQQQESVGFNGLLIGYCGRLFRIEGTYAVLEAQDPYAAIGSGVNFARGALLASEGRDPFERVWLALRAAEHFVPSVRGPFIVIRQEIVRQQPCTMPSGIDVVEHCSVEWEEISHDGRDTDASAPSAA